MVCIGLGIGLHEKGAFDYIQCPIIGLSLPSIFNGYLQPLVSTPPAIAAGIVPVQMRFVDEKGTDLTRLEFGLMLG